jgi:hypothetical protein
LPGHLPLKNTSFSLFIILAGPYDCTFEKGTCGYRNVGESEGLDTFDWTLRIAGTPSGNTGPTTDHTTGRFGNFSFFLQRQLFSTIPRTNFFNSLPNEITSPASASVGSFKSKLKSLNSIVFMIDSESFYILLLQCSLVGK